MVETPPDSPTLGTKSLLRRLTGLIASKPADRRELLELLRQAQQANLIDADAQSMIEGVLQVSEIAARDIMVPRSKMDQIDISQSPEEFIPSLINTGHSRFPVFESNRDNVIGVLHAKDLLRFYAEQDFDVRAMLRPAVFIPESKRLNVLLREFRNNRHHLAIVVDEYGGVSGLITIEDVLEQIVGDIEDEFDFDEESDHVVAIEPGANGPRYRVRALAAIAQINERLGTELSDDEFDTVGGLVSNRFGRLPRRGESIEIGNLRFEVLRADARQLHLLLVERLPVATDEAVERD